MTNQEQERYFLIDSFTRDGHFYIQRKQDLLLTDDSDIKIGSKVQFIYIDEKKVSKEEPKNKEHKIRTGKIIMESENEQTLNKEMERRKNEIERKKITKEEVIEKEKEEHERKRTKFIEKSREGNVAMAIELEKKLNLEIKIKDDLKSSISNARKINETMLQIKQDLEEANI